MNHLAKAVLVLLMSLPAMPQATPPSGGGASNSCGSSGTPCTVPGALNVGGNAAIGGSFSGEASQLFGLLHPAPAMIQFAHGFGTISANSCSSPFYVAFPGIQKNSPVTIGTPVAFPAGLQPFLLVPASDSLSLTLCNPTASGIAAGSGVNFIVTHN